MKKLFLFSLLIAGGAIMTGVVNAANPFSVQYPISELGNCATQGECKTYCDDSANQSACLKWAQDNGFAPKPEPRKPSGQPNKQISEEQRLIDEEALKNAPGSCKSSRECDAYCRVEEHLNECLDYGVRYGYTSKEEADKIRAQAAKGGPGGCKSEKDCNDFCRNPENAKVCMDFVVAEGKITQEEADIMTEQMKKGKLGKPKGKGPAEPKVKEEKIQEVLKEKTGPGGCKNMEECSKYCMGGEHMEECMKFAEENQIMAPEEMEKARKLSSMGGPGGCRNEKECDAFCGKEENRDTCFNFAKDNGLLAPEEVQVMEKQMQIINKMGKKTGPGGCKSVEDCSKFCSDPANIETCVDYARQGGMISGEAVKNMMGKTQEGQEKMKQVEEYQKFREQEPRGEMGRPTDLPFGGESSGAGTPTGQNFRFVPPPQGVNDQSGPTAGMEGQFGQPSQGIIDSRYGPPPGGGAGDFVPPTMLPPEGQMFPRLDQMPPQGFVPPAPTSFNRFSNVMASLGGLLNELFGF